MESLQIKPTLSRTFFTVLIIALLTAFISEIKIIPFENAPFRLGLGSIIFSLAILTQAIPIISTGIITGVTVMLFRACFSTIYFQEAFFPQLLEHAPAAFFYIVFAICFSQLSIEKVRLKPLRLGIYGACFEIIANSVEQLITFSLQHQHFITPEAYLILCAVALLRSFSVVGIYSVITISEQKKQLAHLLSIHADLYVESLYLQKSMEQIENITSDCFQLYKQLKSINPTLSSEALRISQEIHEIKKDAARIYAGLSKIVTTNPDDLFDIVTLLQYVATSNKNYSALLKKDIIINVQYEYSFQTQQHLALLSILNNLVMNAVEAIPHKGEITVLCNIEQEHLLLTVRDNGPGIEPHLLSVIFEPGYTSKFHDNGFASTGIGLSHVQALVDRLQGSLQVTSENETIFTISIPLQTII